MYPVFGRFMQLGLERQQLGKWKEGEWVELREGDVATAAKSDGMPLTIWKVRHGAWMRVRE